MNRRWTTPEIDFVRNHARKMSHAEIAAALGRTKSAIKNLATKGGFHSRRKFSDEEVAYMKAHAGEPSHKIAAALGRKVNSVHSLRKRAGLARGILRATADFLELLKEKHAAGWSDQEIATLVKCERHTIGDWRKRLGLPSNKHSEHQRQRTAAKTREQVAKAGLKSLAEVRIKAFREYAVKYGWPADVRPRQVQMLNALMRNGPMTRRQLADAIGMPWKGSRKSLVGNVPRGSYLADLMARGLVVSLGRVVKGKGSGFSTCLYSIPLWTERNAHGEQTATAG